MPSSDTLFQAAALSSFLIALLHVAMVPFGARAYRYFTAGDWMVERAEEGSWLPGLITLLVAAVFFVFGAYALSCAGTVSSLPWVRPGLVVITTIYLLRGVGLVPQLLWLRRKKDGVAPREAVFSLTSLLVGLVHLAGLMS